MDKSFLVSAMLSGNPNDPSIKQPDPSLINTIKVPQIAEFANLEKESDAPVAANLWQKLNCLSKVGLYPDVDYFSENVYSTYVANYTISSNIFGQLQENSDTITYHIGLVPDSSDKARTDFLQKPFQRARENDTKSIKYDDAIKKRIYELINDSVFNTDNWTTSCIEGFNFDAVVYRLAQCIAMSGFDKNLSLAETVGLPEINASILNDMEYEDLVETYDTMDTSDDTSSESPFCNVVFISELCYSQLGQYGADALIYAVRSCGGTVQTNYKADNLKSVEMHKGLWQAMNYLFVLYSQIDVCDRFTNALFAGITSVLTVEARTGEGALMRDFFRQYHKSLTQPTGVMISIDINRGTLLPLPLITPDSNVRFAHSIALLGAAFVQVSDPGSNHMSSYPTISTVNPTNGCDDNGVLIGKENISQAWFQHKSNLETAVQILLENWTKNMTSYFDAPAPRSSDLILIHQQAWRIFKPVECHVDKCVIAPFNWIEPTSLINPEEVVVSGCKEIHWNIFAPNDGSKYKIPSFESDVETIQFNFNKNYLLKFKYTLLRKNPYLKFLQLCRPQSATTSVIFGNTDIENTVLFSKKVISLRKKKIISTSLDGNSLLSDLFWNCLCEFGGFPAPCEAIFDGPSDAYFLILPWDSPLREDIPSTVQVSVNRPTGTRPKRISSLDTFEVCRSATLAAKSISNLHY